MAVDSGRPIMSWELSPAVVKDDDDDELCEAPEGFEITLEEELVHEYDFTMLFKPNDANFDEYRMLYNMACKAAEQRGDIVGVAELVDIRFEARRNGMENIPLILEVSPYTDEGSALCYGYLEGVFERMNESQSLRERFESQYLTTASLDGTVRTVKVS